MTSYKFLYSSLFLLFFAFVGCKNDEKTPKEQPITSETSTPAPEEGGRKEFVPKAEDSATPEDAPPTADNGFPLFSDEQQDKMRRDLLDGRWVNLSNPNHHLEFTNTEFKVYQSGNVVSTSTYAISLGCNNDDCKATGKTVKIGWCFSADNGCFVIKRCDSKQMHMTDLSTSQSWVFQRLKGEY